MIPRLIHFIWLGDQQPNDFLKACRQSVEELHPQWSILTHDDNRIFNHPLLHPIQDELKTFWEICSACDGLHSPLAVQADLLRLALLYCAGGIYLDHDMYGVQPLDKFLDVPVLLGEIRQGLVAEAIMGTAPENPLILELMRSFMQKRPMVLEGAPHLNNVCMTLPRFCEENQIQPYPTDFFIGHMRKAPDSHRYFCTANTHTLHCWYRDFNYDLQRLRKVRQQVGEMRRLIEEKE